MAKIVTVFQDKGGVGKTTVSKTFAYYLALYLKKRVLLVDLDGQGSLSQRFLKMETDPTAPDGMRPPVNPLYAAGEDPDTFERSNSGEIYYSGQVLPYETNNDLIQIIPAQRLTLSNVELELANTKSVDTRVVERLGVFLRQAEVQSDYDVVLIDTAAHMDAVMHSAIRAADYLVIPILMERQCLEGLRGVFTTWRDHQKRRRVPIQIAGIVPNLYRKVKALHKQYLEQLRLDTNPFARHMVPYELRDNSSWGVADMPTDSTKPNAGSVFQFSPSDKARIDAEKVFEYISTKVFHDEQTIRQQA